MKLIPESLEESLNFERGIDPKKSMMIGLSSPRRFKSIEEFVDYIIKAMPLIFGGKIPEDILSKGEEGIIPESYYSEIVKWLSRGFEMPDGDSDWDFTTNTEFNTWTLQIEQRLEEILGQKRWSKNN
jgi:hypothetical protein